MNFRKLRQLPFWILCITIMFSCKQEEKELFNDNCKKYRLAKYAHILFCDTVGTTEYYINRDSCLEYVNEEVDATQVKIQTSEGILKARHREVYIEEIVAIHYEEGVFDNVEIISICYRAGSSGASSIVEVIQLNRTKGDSEWSESFRDNFSRTGIPCPDHGNYYNVKINWLNSGLLSVFYENNSTKSRNEYYVALIGHRLMYLEKDCPKGIMTSGNEIYNMNNEITSL